MTEKRHLLHCSRGPGPESMAIGEFGGAATLSGDGGALLSNADVLVLRDGPRRAQSGARLRRRHAAVLQESRSIRSRTPPTASRSPPRRNCSSARRAATASRTGASIRPRSAASASPVHIADRLGAAVLPAAAFRARLRASAAPAAAEAADRRADVGPLRDAAARHGRGLPAQPRRLHHRLGRCAHGAAVARAASISTTTSTTSSRCCTRSAATRTSIAVCQPSVPVLAAVALMEADNDPYVPRSMMLMGGPIDTRDQSDRGQQAGRGARHRLVPPATSSPRCRSRIRASCATSIRASCSCTASSA